MAKFIPWFGLHAAMIAANSALAQSGVIDDDYVGCLTDTYFEDYDIAVVSKDWRRRDELMDSVCYEIEGLEYSLIKKSFMGVRIQLTINGETLRLTTSPKAIP